MPQNCSEQLATSLAYIGALSQRLDGARPANFALAQLPASNDPAKAVSVATFEDKPTDPTHSQPATFRSN